MVRYTDWRANDIFFPIDSKKSDFLKKSDFWPKKKPPRFRNLSGFLSQRHPIFSKMGTDGTTSLAFF